MPETAATPLRAGADRLWESVVGEDLSFLLARANAVSLAGASAALAEFGLKVRSYSVLALAAGGHRPSQRELSEFLRLDPSQVVSLVDDLERRELVSREADPNDRRTNVLVVTAEGKKLFARARAAAHAAEQRTFAELPGDEIDRFTRDLRMLANHPGDA